MAISFDTTLPAGYVPPAKSQSKTSVDYESFLKLLIAQMKNQDPTQPMDNTEYVAQLAQFSNVEQGVQINQKLDQMLQSNSLSQATSLIGRTVTSADGETTGVVSEVKITGTGITAILEGGDELVIGPGVTIS